MIPETEQVFLNDIILENGIIRNSQDGLSCSHNDFKKLCRSCMEHYSKDFKLHRAFYEANENYITRVFRKCPTCGEDIHFGGYATVLFPTSDNPIKIPFCPRCEYCERGQKN